MNTDWKTGKNYEKIKTKEKSNKKKTNQRTEKNKKGIKRTTDAIYNQLNTNKS